MYNKWEGKKRSLQTYMHVFITQILPCRVLQRALVHVLVNHLPSSRLHFRLTGCCRPKLHGSQTDWTACVSLSCEARSKNGHSAWQEPGSDAWRRLSLPPTAERVKPPSARTSAGPAKGGERGKARSPAWCGGCRPWFPSSVSGILLPPTWD